jgi:hypothetical protein
MHDADSLNINSKAAERQERHLTCQQSRSSPVSRGTLTSHQNYDFHFIDSSILLFHSFLLVRVYVSERVRTAYPYQYISLGHGQPQQRVNKMADHSHDHDLEKGTYDQSQTTVTSHAVHGVHGHTGKRLRHFFRPDGRKVHIAHSPDEVEKLKRRLSVADPAEVGCENGFDVVIHGSLDHVSTSLFFSGQRPFWDVLWGIVYNRFQLLT